MSRRDSSVVALAIFAAVLCAPVAATRAQQPELRAMLQPVRDVRAESLLTLKISIRMSPGWHIGAQKPGASGLPTTLEWRLPDGWRVVEERWPEPRREVIAGLTLFTYADTLAVDVVLRRDSSNRGRAQAVLSYGLCREVCIPGRTTLTYLGVR